MKLSKLSRSGRVSVAILGCVAMLTASVGSTLALTPDQTHGSTADWLAQAEAAEEDTSEVEVDATDEDGNLEPQAAPPRSDDDPRFSCQVVEGQPTVMYYPQSQPGVAYAWAQPTDLGGGWTAERRCNEISRRLESYRPDGLLEMRTGRENEYDVICVTTQQNSDCRIVLTVPPGQNPQLTRDRVFENLSVADSGQNTEAVATFADDNDLLNDIGDLLDVDLSDITGESRNRPARNRNTGINLRPFLDASDGGTGDGLPGGASANPRLNPDNFR